MNVCTMIICDLSRPYEMETLAVIRTRVVVRFCSCRNHALERRPPGQRACEVVCARVRKKMFLSPSRTAVPPCGAAVSLLMFGGGWGGSYTASSATESARATTLCGARHTAPRKDGASSCAVPISGTLLLWHHCADVAVWFPQPTITARAWTMTSVIALCAITPILLSSTQPHACRPLWSGRLSQLTAFSAAGLQDLVGARIRFEEFKKASGAADVNAAMSQLNARLAARGALLGAVLRACVLL